MSIGVNYLGDRKMRMIGKKPCLLLATSLLLLLTSVSALVKGGEKATFHAVPQIIPTNLVDDDYFNNITNNITSHRQDLCWRYDLYRNRRIHLRDALKGLQLNLLFPLNGGFLYTPEDGLNPGYAGLAPDFMDTLAERAGFTWRKSFGVADPAPNFNMTWTEQLWWGVNTYDV